MGSIARTSCDNAIPLKETCPLCDKPVIAIILNFIIIFKVYPKLPESRRKTLKTQVKLIRAQNLPSLLLLSTNIVLSTLLIQGSMQDACVSYELRNRPRSPWSLCGSVIEHRCAESEGLRFDSSRELRIFSLSHARDKTKKKNIL